MKWQTILKDASNLLDFELDIILPRLPWLIGVSGFICIEIRVDAFGSLMVNIIHFFPYHSQAQLR
jgi:hypothetical protein